MTIFLGACLALGPAPAACQEGERTVQASSLLGKALYCVALEQDDQEAVERRLQQLSRQIEDEPGEQEHYQLLADELMELWRFREAVEVLGAALERFPEDASLYSRRGWCFLAVRRFDLALDDLALAAQLESTSFRIWFRLGLARFLTGDHAGAENTFAACRRLAADDDMLAEATFWRYLNLVGAGWRERAREVLEVIGEGLVIQGKEAEHGVLMFCKGLRDGSQLRLIAERSERNYATVCFGLGAWHLSRGDHARAEAYFEAASEVGAWPEPGCIAAEVELSRAVR